MPAARANATIKRGDLLPELTATLQDADGVAVDLTSATGAEFHMLPVGSATPKVNTAATIVTPALGLVKYTWQGTDTDTAGDYYAEFEVSFADSKTQTFPNDGHVLVRVVEELA